MKIFSPNPIAYGDDGKAYTFVQLRHQVLQLLGQLQANNANQLLVNCNSTYCFLVALLAALKAGKRAIILPNALEETRKHYASTFDMVLDDSHIENLDIHGFDDDGFDGDNFDRDSHNEDGFDDKRNMPAALEIEDNSEIIFYTSGSSGNPAKVIKKFSALWREVTDTTQLSGISEASLVASTVPHHHMYGFLFKVLGPLFAQKPFYVPTVRFPNEMQHLQNFMLISSPAFLARLDESDSITGCTRIISSGGPLTIEAGNRVENIFNARGIEVYGSTETGGIAYRHFSAPKLLYPLPGVTARANASGQLEINSSYMNESGWYSCNDFVKFRDTNSFEVIGRSDDIVKIEEKRISLAEIQKLLTSRFPHIERVFVFPFEAQRRKRLAALVVIKDTQLHNNQFYLDEMTQYLRTVIDPIFIPKKWKLVNSFEPNEMGKTSRARIVKAVFGSEPTNKEVLNNA